MGVLNWSTVWHNGFYVFGGNSNKRQISQVAGTKLTLIGTLSFDHYYGTCDVVGNDKVYLCFDLYDYKLGCFLARIFNF